MQNTNFRLNYITNVGFGSDTGGRAFHHPSCIAIRSDGVIFIGSRSTPTTGIQMVSLDHDYFGTIGQEGTMPGQMKEPSSLALDSDDFLYMADERLNRISIFDRDCEFVSSWGIKGDSTGEFNRPTGLLIREDTVFVVDALNHRIQQYSKKGKFIGQWGLLGSDKGEFRYPWGIADDNDGNIYIADWGNDRVQKFTSKGEYVNTFGSSGDNEGELARPADLIVDCDKNMYIADWGNQRLQVLNSKGNYIDHNRGQASDLNPWVREYFEGVLDEARARKSFDPIFDVDTSDLHEISARLEPLFWDPSAVACDQKGRIYVVDTCRHRIQIFERITCQRVSQEVSIDR